MKNFKIQLDEESRKTKLDLIIDGENEGFLELSSLGTGSYYIELIEINKAFRGKGFYKTLLLATFQIAKAEMLVSNNRNTESNSIYEKWCGCELANDQEVTIALFGESFYFDVTE